MNQSRATPATPSSKPSFHSFASEQELVNSLAKEVAGSLSQAIEQDDCASLVVSGGRTPVVLFQHLSGAELDWSKVLITLADERWVAPDHPDSNEYLVRTHLLTNRAKQAQFVSLKNNASSARLGQVALAEALADLPDVFTVVMLGMGDDGHTASLFPGASTLEIALNRQNPLPCQWIQPPNAPHDRMTLTLSRLLAAKKIFLHFTGAKKRAVYDAAIADDNCDYPVRVLANQQQTPIEVYWHA